MILWISFEMFQWMNYETLLRTPNYVFLVYSIMFLRNFAVYVDRVPELILMIPLSIAVLNDFFT